MSHLRSAEQPDASTVRHKSAGEQQGLTMTKRWRRSAVSSHPDVCVPIFTHRNTQIPEGIRPLTAVRVGSVLLHNLEPCPGPLVSLSPLWTHRLDHRPQLMVIDNMCG